jgi:hypothetical protein
MQYFLKQLCGLSLIKLHIVQGVNNVQKCLFTAFSSLTTKLGTCHPNVCTAETGSQLLTATSYITLSVSAGIAEISVSDETPFGRSLKQINNADVHTANDIRTQYEKERGRVAGVGWRVRNHPERSPQRSGRHDLLGKLAHVSLPFCLVNVAIAVEI